MGVALGPGAVLSGPGQAGVWKAAPATGQEAGLAPPRVSAAPCPRDPPFHSLASARGQSPLSFAECTGLLPAASTCWGHSVSTATCTPPSAWVGVEVKVNTVPGRAPM